MNPTKYAYRKLFPRLVLIPFLFLVSVLQAQDIPRTAAGNPDFSGIWQTLSPADYGLESHGYRKDSPPVAGIINDGTIPYQDWARQQLSARRSSDLQEADPASSCFSLGTPRGIYYPEPFQLFQRDRDLTLLFQRGFRARTIHTNASSHPDGPIGFWFGDSRGEWEGDTLVVDVVDFSDRTWLDRSGNFHSEQLHVVERWRFIDADTIEYQATLEDPLVYEHPWQLQVLLYRHKEPNFQLVPNTCYTLDYDEDYPIPAWAYP